MNKNEKIKKFAKTKNFFNYKNFYKFIASQNFTKLVEVGSWKGHSISFLAQELVKQGNKFDLYAVDLWDKSVWKNRKNKNRINFELDHIYDIYNFNLRDNQVRQYINDIKGDSAVSASIFEDRYFDFVFIDADHREESVKKDILAWLPKVKKGGIIAGHDYYNQGPMRAKAAVNSLVKNNILPKIKTAKGTVWYCKI